MGASVLPMQSQSASQIMFPDPVPKTPFFMLRSVSENVQVVTSSGKKIYGPEIGGAAKRGPPRTSRS